MRKQIQVRRGTSLSLFLFFFSIVSYGQITSDFSANDDGWLYFDPGTGGNASPSYSSTGGNPTGNISFTTSSGFASFYWVAPSKFQGNRSLSYNQNLTFDLKVSTTGTDNSVGDVVLVGNGLTLTYQFAAKPTAGVWTSYSVPLLETQWKNGCPTCGTATQVQMKQALANVTQLKIRLKYLAGGGSYTGQLDNVVLNVQSVGATPTITSFAPTSALAGTTVTITGTNFDPTPSQNSVSFKGIKASVTNATATQLTVTVPASASFGPITVANLTSGLQGSSTQNFDPLFDNNKDFGGRIIPASMSRGYSTMLAMASSSNGFGGLDKGDIDADGWNDLVITETGTSKIYVYANLGTGGTVGASSFGSPVTLSLSTVPGGGPSLSEVIVTDVDSDGKLDVAASASGNLSAGTAFLAVFRNTSTPGVISFASPVFFAYPYYTSLAMTSGDLDGDGRVDFAFTTGSSPGNVWVVQNLSTAGNVDFAYGLAVGTTVSHTDLAIADLNNDAKPELIVATGSALEVYQNASTPGTISLNSPFSVPATSGSYIAVADLDADNKIDLIWSAYGAQYIYYSQNIYSGGAFGSASFGASVAITSKLANPDGMSVSDINSDGKPDIIIVGSSDVGIMQNVGSTGALGANSFLQPALVQGSASGSYIYGTGPAIADLDGDNKPEVVFVYTNSSVPVAEKGVYILHNECYPVPTITSTSPTSATTGASVALNGNLMFTGNVAPSVRLNKAQASVSGSTTNILTTVINPTGGISGKFNVINHGLTAFSPSFNFSFGTTRVINSSAFGPSVDFGLSYGVRDVLETADYDDDGKMDIIISDNNGVGIFQNSTTPGQTISVSSLTKLATTYSAGANVVVNDFDGDGKIDLNSGSGIWQNTSSSNTISFASSVFSQVSNPNGVASADFNKDGKVDVATTNNSSLVNIYENRSTRGVFINNGYLSTYFPTPAALSHPTSKAFSGNQCIVAADFDGDGYEDIAATASSDDSFTFFRNLAVYGFISSSSFSLGTTVATASQPSGITVNDFDGDGKLDVAVVHYNSTAVNVYLNTSSVGSISFAAPVNLTGGLTFGYNISSQDLDGDGKAEIVTTRNPNPGTPSFSIFQNNSTVGSLNFGTAVTYTMSRYPQAIAFADINADTKPDILIVASSGLTPPATALMVYQNNIASPVISIGSQPAPVYSVCDGATPTISTSASGTTNITYQWQILASPSAYADLTNTGGYSNVSTSSITINSTGNFGGGTYRCKISGDFASTVYSNTVSFTVNPIPTTPTAGDINFCPPNTVNMTASGGSNGQYLWYDQSGLVSGQNNSTYTTPSISVTSNYSVAITDGVCVSPKVNVKAVAQAIPAIPTATDVNFCPSNTVLLTASGATNGQYLWYDQNGLINGQTNNTYTTPSISATTSYSVAITNGTCTSAKISVKAVAQPAAAPATADVNFCPPNTVALTASGGSAGQYLWYDQNGLIIGQTNSTYTTPSISSTTSYAVAISNGTCTSAQTTVKAVAQAIPAAPTVADVNYCPPNTVAFTATGGSAGQYLWYDQNGLINGQTNSTYTTPSISSTTSYAVAISNGTCTSAQTTVKAVALAIPAAPTATDTNYCPPSTVALSATGGSAGQYLWYDQNGLINGQTNGTYTTPSISSTTSYFVAINNGTCTSTKTNVKAIAQAIPSAPAAADVSFCAPGTAVLTASGGNVGQYLWYDQNGLIGGETNSTYTTPSLSVTTSYSVAITNSFCTSLKTTVKAVATTSGCSAPVITPEPLTTQVGGKIIIDLKPLIATPNSTLDLTSLQVTIPPSSGAVASIDANGILTITYSSTTFSGTENITIKACDENHSCTQQKFGIDVAGDIEVFNGISPDGANPKFVIQFIELLPETKNNHVSIFDRWGNLVWHGTNYDNTIVVFTGHSDSGNALPSGVYFYKAEFASGHSTRTGFISLRR
jgi:hypothetical protein